MSEQLCKLCQTSIKCNGYREGEWRFCCIGCCTVYQILSYQNRLENFKSHPVFKQALHSGLISNPDLIEQIQHQKVGLPEEEFKKFYLEIQEMWCPSCAQLIYLILIKERGIRSCTVDYTTDLACIEYAPRHLSREKIFKLIEQIGYKPATLQNKHQQAVSASLYLRFIIAAFFSANIMMFAYPIYASYFYEGGSQYALLFSWLSLIGSLPVLTYSAWPIWRRFYAGIKARMWGMEALVLMGITAAFGLSLFELLRGSHYVYFDSMSVIIAFVLLGKIIESKAKFSAKDSLITLTRGLPRRGRKQMMDGSMIFIPLKEIEPGDYLVVLAGEKIVLDGVIAEGEGICDESLMTGECFPIMKRIGSSVLAGSILQQGRFLIKVTAKPEETFLHHIIHMVEQDISHKFPYIRAADRIVKGFVPFVLSLALGTAIYCWMAEIQDVGYTVAQTAIIRAMSILLISCPCAIGIAAPLAESYLLNALAKMGAIVRNRGCLTFLGNETTFIFDKTGTITEGKFSVQSGISELVDKEKAILKELVSYSNHPIAVAISQAVSHRPHKLQQMEEVIGKGIRGRDGVDLYILGSAQFLKEQEVVVFPSIVLSEQTTVFFAKNQDCLATLVLGDQIRPDIKEMADSLKPLKTWVISGDSSQVVQTVSRACGFDQWRAEFSPLKKREFVEALKAKGEVVAMLGDGVNDAPALTAAHIGIAVASATDFSAQVSDIVLTTNRLLVIPHLRQVAIKGRCIIKQNLFWAFFYNVIGIALAMTGTLSPVFAACAMVASSLIVLLNTQRIR